MRVLFFFELHAHRYSLPPQKDKNDTELPAEGGINMTMLYSDVKLAPNTAERDGFKARETLRYAATLHRSGLISVFFFVCVYSTSPINFVRLTALHHRGSSVRLRYCADASMCVRACLPSAGLKWKVELPGFPGEVSHAPGLDAHASVSISAHRVVCACAM